MPKRSTKRKAFACTEHPKIQRISPPRHSRVEFWKIYAFEGVKPSESLEDMWDFIHRLYCATMEFLHVKSADGPAPADDPDIEALRRKLYAVEDILDHVSRHAYEAMAMRKRERRVTQRGSK
jgi:hypothetical protein